MGICSGEMVVFYVGEIDSACAESVAFLKSQEIRCFLMLVSQLKREGPV